MTPTTRRAAVAALALIATAALTACTTQVAGIAAAQAGPAAGSSTAVADPTAQARYYGQHLSWGPCAPFAQDDSERTLYSGAGLDCATLTVPLDYSAPDGRTAKVGVLRHRTDGAKIGSLVVNPGGPGGSGMSLAAQLGPALAGGPFDVVGFDPRGVGASTPTIDCATDRERDRNRAENFFDTSPAGVAHADEENRKAAAECVERSGGADVIANSGTRDVARDMDVLRAALGDEKLTYLGFSYGTRIGTTYAELFGRNVRAMVLDGAIDPMEDPVASGVAQMAGFQQAFDTFAAACAAAANCPLGTDPARTTQAFQALARPLIDKPAPVRGDSRTLSFSDAVTAVVASLYSPEQWPGLTAALTDLKAGDGTAMMALADAYNGRTPAGTYDNDQEALSVVNCADGDRISDRAVIADATRRVNEAAPFQDPGRPAPASPGVCTYLPVEPAAPHVPQVAGLPQTLVISTTGDPSTPYQGGVNLAKALGARLLTVEGTKHTAALQGNECVDDVVGNYLVNLQLPSADARCAAKTS
ncbi:alpha/beta hydrolase [Pseudonocardia benzenivorans]|uniref:Alpha/beta hydrolase n=1 Tax=Pseudonocardia benzenivorans TaxID=228005 RepID=A0ABW3VQY1_9PSEU|nr:alpha/beta hydrolase [Pseudonocardia sp. D17]